MRLLRKGRAKPCRNGAENALVNVDPYIIRAGEIAGILADPYVVDAFDHFAEYRAFDRLPYAGGTSEQPADIVDALRALIEEDRAIEAENTAKE